MDPNTGAITTLTGPPFVSLILNWCLFGALSIQVYLYGQVFTKDSLRLRLLVYGVYVLETVQVALLTTAVWQALASGFGNIQGLNVIGPYPWIAVCIIGGIVTFLVQLFYARRIRAVSENRYLSWIVILMSTTSLIGALLSGIDFAQIGFFDRIFNNKSKAHILVGIWIASGSACDVLIAILMCYYLRKRVQGIEFPSTQRLITRLVRLTVETGTLTASVSIVSLALFYVRAVRLDWEVPLSSMAKLYSTTLLAVLNSRMNLPSVIPESKSSSYTDSTAIARAPNHIQLQVLSDIHCSSFGKDADNTSGQLV